MEKVELKKGIYWVGAIDWNIRYFHGYSTPYGTTYNAYLILDEKNVLVDTVKAPFYLEMLGRISEIIDPSRIDVVVSNHVEMDHSGSLTQMVERIGDPTVICSERGQKGLTKHYKKSLRFRTVKSGETFSIACLLISKKISFFCRTMLLASILPLPKDLKMRWGISP
jgi:flavorubredoxin